MLWKFRGNFEEILQKFRGNFENLSGNMELTNLKKRLLKCYKISENILLKF